MADGFTPEAAFAGVAPWFGGHNEVMTMTHADTVNFDLFMVEKDGKEQPVVKITYKRKK